MGASDSTITPHSATISTWLLCVGKDGLPVCLSVEAIVPSWTVCCFGRFSYVWERYFRFIFLRVGEDDKCSISVPAGELKHGINCAKSGFKR